MVQLSRPARARVFAACLAGLLVSACSARARPAVIPAPGTSNTAFIGLETIGELKDFAEGMGGHATDNFLRHSDRHAADTRCYFTGRLELPEFYSTLRMVREDGDRCAARGADHDVFFYAVEAVASGEETITVSLAEAPTERVLVVVPHEDFHNQRELRKAPTEVAEAAATLVGFLTASAFAKDKYGADSPMSRRLDRDAELFLQKSAIVNEYFARVDTLYRTFRSGGLSPAETLERKAALFDDLRQACAAIAPDPASFNKCPAVMNNAGLAFDHTYTRHYPMVYELYRQLGRDPATLVARLKSLMADWPGPAREGADLVMPR